MNGRLYVRTTDEPDEGEGWKGDQDDGLRYFCGDVEISEEEFDDEIERRIDRERFAGFALQGMLASGSDFSKHVTQVAQVAWDYADEMLKTRGY